jgi:hypothetical protein
MAVHHHHSKANDDEPSPPPITGNHDERRRPTEAASPLRFVPGPRLFREGNKTQLTNQPAAKAAVVTRSSAARRLRPMTTITPD